MIRAAWIASVRSSMANRRQAARLALMRTPVAQRWYDRAKCRNCFPKMAAHLALPTLDSALPLTYRAPFSLNAGSASRSVAGQLRGTLDGSFGRYFGSLPELLARSSEGR